MISKMIQAEFLQSWPDYNSVELLFEESGLHFVEKDAQLGSFSLPSISMEDSSNDASSVLLSSPLYADDDLLNLPLYEVDSPVMFTVEQFLLSSEEINTPLNDQFIADEVEGLCEWMMDGSSPSSQLEEDAFSVNLSSIGVASPNAQILPSDQKILVFPSEGMEVDEHLSILHLLKAYGEAKELEQNDLTKEIISRLKEKACPTGIILERLAYYLIQAFEKQVDYLTQESSKIYEAAFRAFYQIFPYGRFAHFAANSIILEAIPEDAGRLHIVDFDIGQGVQWPPLIEALARRGHSLVQLTSIKWEEEDCSYFPPIRSFEETKKRLFEHARAFGVRLNVEEVDMEGLVSLMKTTKKRGGRNEWLAFNCMVGLPHMGTVRSVKHVIEFLKVAKDSINPLEDSSVSSRGIVSVGSGSEVEERDSSGFESFFEKKLVQVQAFFESMEWHFPVNLTEARTAMECLFLAPQVSSLTGSQNREESFREGRALTEIGLKAWRISKDNLMEAKELVREGESLYQVRTGENESQMVLGYMGTPLVKVTCWR